MNKKDATVRRGYTRRHWAAAIAAAPMITGLLGAQVATTPQTPPPVGAPPPSTPEERLAKAVADVRQVSDRLAQTEVPMSIEPAFTFHA